MTIKMQKRLVGTLFLGLPLLWLTVFIVAPIFVALYLSFTSYDVLTAPEWIGTLNYQDLRFDPVFIKSILNTLYYTGVSVPVGVALSLALALFVNQKFAGVGLVRGILYAPVVAPMVAVALVWNLFYDPVIGLFNYVLNLLGFSSISWLNSAQWAMPSIILMSIWKSAGFNMIIFLAGLQGIPKELYEAARLDGANGGRLFWGITLPLLKNSMLYVLVTAIIGSFQVFSQIVVMTNGGPNNSTTTIVHQTYRNAFVHLDMGYASAMAFVLFALLILLAVFNMRFFRSEF